MTTIESQPDEITGDVEIGQWQLYGFHMRAEMTYAPASTVPAAPALLTVYLRNRLARRKWRICTAQATHVPFGLAFCSPFDSPDIRHWALALLACDQTDFDLRFDKPFDGSSPVYSDLWRESIRAKLLSEYVKYGQRCLQEAPC